MMKALLYKDLKNHYNRRGMYSFLFIIIFPIFFTILGLYFSRIEFGIVSSFAIIGSVFFQCFSLDEIHHTNEFLKASPVSYRVIVGEKFLLLYLYSFLFMIVLSLTILVFHLWVEDLKMVLLIYGVCFFSAAFYFSFSIPLSYKFGMGKASLISMGLFVFLVIVLAKLCQAIEEHFVGVGESIISFCKVNHSLCTIGFLAIMVFLESIIYFISLRCFNSSK